MDGCPQDNRSAGFAAGCLEQIYEVNVYRFAMTPKFPRVIMYFKTTDIDSRNIIDAYVQAAGYKWQELTGAQAAYIGRGKFQRFVDVVNRSAAIHNIKVTHILHTDDPGLGLFTPDQLHRFSPLLGYDEPDVISYIDDDMTDYEDIEPLI